MSNERKLPFGFERVLTQDENNVLEVLSTEDGMLLTRIALSLDTIEETEDITSLLDRGMAEWKDERLEVTEKGMKAVSLYPLLGTKRTRRIYPEAFFPFQLPSLFFSPIPQCIITNASTSSGTQPIISAPKKNSGRILLSTSAITVPKKLKSACTIIGAIRLS